MTTTVVISMPSPNHKAARVVVTNPKDGAVYFDDTIAAGQAVTRYVHDGSVIAISEVEAAAPVDPK